MKAAGSLALVRLLHLASPALPVGGYSYSQGLEQAVDAGTVRDEAGAGSWVGDVLEWTLARWDAPVVASLVRAWSDGDIAAVVSIGREFVASRESAELRAEALQMGHSLARLLSELAPFDKPGAWRDRLTTLHEPAYPTVWAGAAAAWAISPRDAVIGYLASWLENQVTAAVKLVPLGQSAGQRMLSTIAGMIPELAERACVMDGDAYANFAPGLAIASASHETQYSRLFRS